MDYAGFSHTLGRLRKGPSPLEIAAWLGAGALGGVADSMQRNTDQTREDARFEREMALREAYQQAQMEAMQGNQNRENLAFQQEYGLDPRTGQPLSTYEASAPLPHTDLPGPSDGGAWLRPPARSPFGQQPDLQVRPDPAPVRLEKRPVVGLAARRIALQERAQQSALATTELERQKAQVALNEAMDPETKRLKVQEIQAQIDARKASAASAYANATESKARAGLYAAKTDALTQPETDSAASYAKRYGLSEPVYRQYLLDFKGELAGPMPDPVMRPQEYDAWLERKRAPADMGQFLPWLSKQTGRSAPDPASTPPPGAASSLSSGHESVVKWFRNDKTGKMEQHRLSEDGRSWVKIGA